MFGGIALALIIVAGVVLMLLGGGGAPPVDTSTISPTRLEDPDRRGAPVAPAPTTGGDMGKSAPSGQ